MRVLVVAHRLELGGTQTISIELAARVSERHGAEVVLAAAPGPAEDLARERGVDLRLLPDAASHPSWSRVRALQSLAAQLRPDLVHVWDWPQCFDAYPGLHLARRLPMLCTVMGMVVPSFIPRQLPTTFGTEELAARARRLRRAPVHLLEPPVDLDHNSPERASGAGFRAGLGIADAEVVVVMVNRLERWLKLEGILRGLEAVDALAAHAPVRLVVVGEGSARAQIEARATEINARHGRAVVLLTGGLVDPRPAYAAADIMLGMGSSALRTMAFACPMIVVGERGFSRILDEDSLSTFLHQGFYGLNDGRVDDLTGQLAELVDDEGRRKHLGAWARQVVVDRFGLDDAADRLMEMYVGTVDRPMPLVPALTEAARATAIVLGQRLGRAGRRAVAPRARSNHG